MKSQWNDFIESQGKIWKKSVDSNLGSRFRVSGSNVNDGVVVSVVSVVIPNKS